MLSFFRCSQSDKQTQKIKSTIKISKIYAHSADTVILQGSPASEDAASYKGCKILQIRNIRTRAMLAEHTFDKYINYVKVLPDGNILVLLDYREVLLFDASLSFRGEIPGINLSSHALALNERQIMMAPAYSVNSIDQWFTIYDCETETTNFHCVEEFKIEKSSDMEYNLAKLADGRIACRASDNREYFKIFFFEERTRAAESKEAPEKIYKLVASITPSPMLRHCHTAFTHFPDGRIVTYSGFNFQVWDGTDCIDNWGMKNIHPRGYGLRELHALDDGRTLLMHFHIGKIMSTDSDDSIVLFDMTTREHLSLYQGETIFGFALTPSGVLTYSPFDSSDLHVVDCVKAAHHLATASKEKSCLGKKI